MHENPPAADAAANAVEALRNSRRPIALRIATLLSSCRA
jgi:hypothetical protein